MSLSGICVSFGLLVMAAYIHTKDLGINVEAFEWIPITSFSFVILSASLGVLTLPFLVISETMPEKVSSIGFFFGWMWAVANYSIWFADQKFRYINLHEPVVGVLFHHHQIVPISGWVAWHAWMHDFVLDLLDCGRHFHPTVCARNEREKFRWNHEADELSTASSSYCDWKRRERHRNDADCHSTLECEWFENRSLWSMKICIYRRHSRQISFNLEM